MIRSRTICCYTYLFLLLSMILVACSPASNSPLSSPTTEYSSTDIGNITSIADQANTSPTETAVETPLPSQIKLPAPPSTQTVEAMQLFFPTVIPAEGAEFRPPIYQIPWALSQHDHFYFSWPIAATYPAEPVWDYRYGGIFFGPDVIHTGIDLPAPGNTEVMAVGPGTVVWAGWGLYSGIKGNIEDPLGIAVAIRHDFGYKNQQLFTVYAHMSEVNVVVGQHLSTGENVGNVGETGVTTGPHLHFEVRVGENDFWETRNPELWLAPAQGNGVVAGRVMSTHGTILDSYIVTLKSFETGFYTTTYTYALYNVHRDDYYQENMVVGGLKAGLYEINIPYGALNRTVTIEVLPGQVTYFNFYGYSGFDFSGSPTTTPSP